MSSYLTECAKNDTNNYPPFCELCLVKFTTNYNASLHFNGPQHQNKVYLAFHRQPSQKLIWCQVCCVELNTEKVLELHKQSPKHLKKEDAYHEIQMLKQEYLKSLEKPNMVIVVGDNIESVEKTSENTSDVNENESYKQVKESFEDPGLD